jgi:hypothetical protein
MRRTYIIDWVGYIVCQLSPKGNSLTGTSFHQFPSTATGSNLKSIIKGKIFLAVLMLDIKCDRDQKAH